MTNGTIVTLKKNTTHDVEPSAESLYQAELAINTADAKIFTKRDDGTVLSQSIGTVQANYFNATTTATDQVIDSFDGEIYRSAKYVIQTTHGTDYQTIEILVIYNGTNVYITRYGLMFTNTELAEFSAQYNVNNTIEVLADVANPSTTIKFTKTVVQA